MPSKYATVASECQQRVKCAQHDASERLSFIHMAALCVVMVFSLFVGSAFAQDDVTAFFDRADTTSTTTIDHTVWTKLLQKHVVVGKPDQLNRIDYRAFKSSDHAQLKAYVAQLEAIDPRQYNRKEQFAYWANLYNAKTIDVVLDHYPVKSIRNISIGSGLFDAIASTVGAGGPWKPKTMQVAGVKLSLDDIEHAIMRPIFEDPRVHYAVNCASVGCPNLQVEAFTSANLEAKLESAAKDFVNSPRGFAIKDGKVTASSIYKWFEVDFGASQGDVIKHALNYATPELASKLKAIDDYAYDWQLNDIIRSKN